MIANDDTLNKPRELDLNIPPSSLVTQIIERSNHPYQSASTTVITLK